MAGLANAMKANEIDANENIVCLVTGHGFKDSKATEVMIKDNHIKHINETKEINLNGL